MEKCGVKEISNDDSKDTDEKKGALALNYTFINTFAL